MERYDYREALRADIITYFQENGLRINCKEDIDEIYETYYDDMFVNDSITGNASGSYTFNTWQAEENISHNLDLIKEAYKEFGYESIDILDWEPEAMDVTVRCYLLSEVLREVLEDIINQEEGMEEFYYEEEPKEVKDEDEE